MHTAHSEYVLSPDEELHMEGDAIHIEGVGIIGQHFSYLNTCWEKGVPYFVRDVYIKELESKILAICSRNEIENVLNRIYSLNSNIQAHEHASRRHF